MNIANMDSVFEYMNKVKDKIMTVIHCAALTDTKHCEDDPVDCYLVNSIGTYNLMEYCDCGDVPFIKLVYISTDHVFDGSAGDYKEFDLPNPRGHYATSKYIGERFVLANPNNLVIRTSFMKDFTIPKAFTDKYMSLLWADELAKEIKLAVGMDLKGVYHIAGPRKSIYDFVKQRYPKVGKIELIENPRGRAGLPYMRDTSLDCSKWEHAKGINKRRD